MSRFLIIQTAFIGDVILVTGVIEKLKQYFPDAHIDILVRKGNESLIKYNPHISSILTWNKSKNKLLNLIKLAQTVKRLNYDYIINFQRHFSTGYIVWKSGAKTKIGFDKNPFSFCYDNKVKHEIGTGSHEIERNHKLISSLTDNEPQKPKIYLSPENVVSTKKYKSNKYVCIAPASIWFTKQLPVKKWVEVIKKIDSSFNIYLLGSNDDVELCEDLKQQSSNDNVTVLAGKLNLLESASLMEDAVMNYVNDSAPLHIASAVNAPVCAVFCSTIPDFGFYPLSDISQIVQISSDLVCRPCGLHGKKECPEKHFRCANDINADSFLY